MIRRQPGSTQETRVYQLIYSPLLSGESSGGVSFVNEQVGEFWYDLQLTALPAATQRLPEVQGVVCEMGKQQAFALPLENPTSAELVLRVSGARSYWFIGFSPA
eukprot:SAG11_NODE_1730_length_4364_cov_1.545369_2_plen_104_part_00